MDFTSRLQKVGDEIITFLNQKKPEPEKQGGTNYIPRIRTPDFEIPSHMQGTGRYRPSVICSTGSGRSRP